MWNHVTLLVTIDLTFLGEKYTSPVSLIFLMTSSSTFVLSSELKYAVCPAANRVVEFDEMWRAREKELELESKMKGRSGRSKDRDDFRGEKRKSDLRNHISSSRVEQEGTTYNNSYSDQEDGLRDDEIERFLHSRSVRIFIYFLLCEK
jgi:hypothetical protein